jgi:hypothetical protein
MVRIIDQMARNTGIIREALSMQRKELATKGIHFILDGHKYCESAYNPLPLFAAYQSFIDNYDARAAAEQYDEMEKPWCTEIGVQQRLMPVHIMQEMCSVKGSSTRTLDFLHQNTVTSYYNNTPMGTTGPVFPLMESKTQELGLHFALAKTDKGAVGSGSWWWRGLRGVEDFSPTKDLAALKTLVNIRTAELMPEPNLITEHSSGCCILS